MASKVPATLLRVFVGRRLSRKLPSHHRSTGAILTLAILASAMRSPRSLPRFRLFPHRYAYGKTQKPPARNSLSIDRQRFAPCLAHHFLRGIAPHHSRERVSTF